MELSLVQTPELSLALLIGLALIDSINPCVIGVLILLLTVLLKSGSKKAILVNGGAYVVGVYLTYLLGGLTLLTLFTAVREIVFISQSLYFFIGAFIAFAGLLEIKDFFWYGRWYSLSIPAGMVKTVESQAGSAPKSLFATFSAGAILTLIELPCTGAPYLAVLTLMSQNGFGYLTGLPLLLLYNFVFVLPLLVIIYLAYAGVGMKLMDAWRREHRGTMRLAIGIALLAIAVWTITAVAEALLVPLILFIMFIVAAMGVLKYGFKF